MRKIHLFVILSLSLLSSQIADAETNSKLLFKSGFGKGVSLETPWNDGGGCWEQEIKGKEASSQFSWPARIWGATGHFQVLVDSSLKSDEYIKNSLVTIKSHDGTVKQVLHQKIFKRDTGWTQDPLMFSDDEGKISEKGDLYVKYWLKFPANIVKYLGDGSGEDDGWCTFFEWKTAGDYRIAAYVYTDPESNSIPYWYVHGDNVAKDNFGKYREYWSEENHTIPVPEDRWFKVEFFWHRSTKADGRFWWSIDNNVIVDHYGPNKKSKPINRIMLFTLYAAKYPFEQWVDDVEIRDGFPNMPPVVKTPLKDLTVPKSTKTTTIDLSRTFTDSDNQDKLITLAIRSNTNPAIITATIKNRELILKYTPSKKGDALITISGTSDEVTVYNSFKVTVRGKDK